MRHCSKECFLRHAAHSRIAVLLIILLALTAAAAAGPEASGESVRLQKSHWDLIQNAVDTGAISPEQGLVFSAVALFAPERLPAPLRGAQLGKCGTPVLAELEARWWSLSEWARETLSAWPVAAGARGLTRAESRPILSDIPQTLATPHFLIHYALAGVDAVAPADANGNGIPDYVDAVAQALERSRTVEVEILGWLEPPSDGRVDPESPSYDVYIQRLTVQGLTFPEVIVGDNEHSEDVIEPFARCSYIILHSQLNPGILQVTAAHEYNHAIQFGYNAAAEGFDARRWLMEGTATWMEDQVYDDVNDNIGYLPRLLAAPDRSLTHPDNHYASWLFFQHIEEHAGGQATVRSIWQRSTPLTGDFSTLVIQQALQAAGSEPRSAFADFCAANLLLLPCELAPSPFCYNDALLYRRYAGTSFIEGTVTLAEGEAIYIPSDGVQPLSCDNIRVDSSAWSIAAGGYAGSESADIRGLWVGRSDFSVETRHFPMLNDPEPPASSVSPGFYDTLYIVVANVTDPASSSLAVTGYGLMFAASGSAAPSSTPTPTSTPSTSATPTVTLTASATPESTPGRRLWLPAVSRD
jgi:hypothetical protein